MFVASDFSGIIMKEPLIQADLNRAEFASIKAYSHLLAFLGCAHILKDVQDLESKITRFALSRVLDTFMVREARCLSSTISSLSDSFLRTQILAYATIVNMYSTSSSTTGGSKTHPCKNII